MNKVMIVYSFQVRYMPRSSVTTAGSPMLYSFLFVGPGSWEIHNKYYEIAEASVMDYGKKTP